MYTDEIIFGEAHFKLKMVMCDKAKFTFLQKKKKVPKGQLKVPHLHRLLKYACQSSIRTSI